MKQIIKLSVLIISLSLQGGVLAQNPAIFKGGTADGWVSQGFIQNSNNISRGGNADGWVSQAFLQNSSNIYKGGVADGWVSQNFTQISSNIFKGGAGDGWNALTYLQGTLSIFKGGSGDGWDSRNFTQSSTEVYKGGIGDGWASNYRPQAPIPVTFLYFTARKVGEASTLLNWKTTQEINSAYFEVERSTDAVNYIYLGRVAAAGNSQSPREYYFTDNQPVKGLDYYRLRQIDFDGHFEYTPSRLVRFDNMTAGRVSFYPNPTSGLLNIKLTPEMMKEARVVNITNALGEVLNQLKLEVTSNPIIQINLSGYPKGNYFVQVKTRSVNSFQKVVVQ